MYSKIIPGFWNDDLSPQFNDFFEINIYIIHILFVILNAYK